VPGRDAALEGDAVCFGGGIAIAMLDEVKPLFFIQRGLEVGRFADQARFPFLTNTAAKQRLDEDELVPVNQALNLVLGRIRPQNLCSGKFDIVEQACAVQHSGNLHHSLPTTRS